MNNRQLLLEDIHGETKSDFLQEIKNDERNETLINIGWDILDLLPEKRLKELKTNLINEIIEGDWDL